MKARVIATGEIVDVHRLCASSQGDIWQKKSGKEYFAHELDFDVKEPPKPRYNPDYWTRLEHQYAGMAMQGVLNNSLLIAGLLKVNKSHEDIVAEVTGTAVRYAHALVEKLKEKEERK